MRWSVRTTGTSSCRKLFERFFAAREGQHPVFHPKQVVDGAEDFGLVIDDHQVRTCALHRRPRLSGKEVGQARDQDDALAGSTRQIV